MEGIKKYTLVGANVEGGGSTLTLQDEGVVVSADTTTVNFTGSNITASLTAPGVVRVDATDLNSNVANANLVMDNTHTVQMTAGEAQFDLTFFRNVIGVDNIMRINSANSKVYLGAATATEYAWPSARSIAPLAATGNIVVGSLASSDTVWQSLYSQATAGININWNVGGLSQTGFEVDATNHRFSAICVANTYGGGGGDPGFHVLGEFGEGYDLGVRAGINVQTPSFLLDIGHYGTHPRGIRIGNDYQVGCGGSKSVVASTTNVAIGVDVAQAMDATAEECVVIGKGAAPITVDSRGTTAIGYISGLNLGAGQYNTMIGANSGSGVTTGFSNTAIGADTILGAAQNNCILLGRAAEQKTGAHGEVAIGSLGYPVSAPAVSVATASTHKIPITWNGLQFYLLVTN